MKSVNQDSKNKIKSIILLTLAFLLVAIVGATFAYFRAQVGDGANVDINASTDTVDTLVFEKGDAIEILANQDNFGKDEEGNVKSITKETFVRARLIPNNTNNHAKAKYNVYFVIDKNDFIYTTKEQTPELLLKITDPDKKEITDLPGFTYNEDLGGFDITTKRSSMYAFKIAEDYPIEANEKEEVQNWKIEVTLVNLTSNQNENGGKTFNGRIHITTDKKELYKLYNINKISTDTTYKSIDATLDIDEGISEVDKYYYAIETTDEEPSPVKINLLATDLGKKYIASNSPTYNFITDEEGNLLEENKNYKIYSYIVDSEGYYSNIYSTVVKTDEYKLVEVNDLEYTTTWNSISITGVKTTDGDGEAKEYSFWNSRDRIWSAYSTDQTYAINGLDENEQVTIMVQVKDSNERVSNPYDKVIVTDAYLYPTITNFNVSDITINSMKVKVGVNKGQSNISKVEVQYVGESENTWHEATLIDGLYTIDFNGLILGTKYDFKIRVTDEYKTKVYEDISYTGTTKNTHRVSVTVTNGNADASSKDIIHGQTATFTITANPNYDITRATLTYNPNNKCKLDNGTLKVENVTEDISCSINIPINQYQVKLEVTNGRVTTANPLNVDHGGTGTFTIEANDGYDINSAKVTSGNCTLGNVSGKTRPLTVSQVTNARICTVDIPSTKKTMNDVCPNGGTLTECLTQLGNDPKRYVGDGELIQHTKGEPNSAGDDGYRYSGNNPNNFICFGKGSEDYNDAKPNATCDPKNQYRIIGLVPVTVGSSSQTLVKVIKSEYITKEELGRTTNDGTVPVPTVSYTDKKRVQADVTKVDGFKWNNALPGKWNINILDNTWSNSTLKEALNGTYLNTTIGDNWKGKIETVQWNVGGVVGGVDNNFIAYTPKAMKNAEESMETEGQGGKITSTDKIGLMYVHDYGFASAKGNWGETLVDGYNSDENRNNNWLFNGVYEWTISRDSGTTIGAFQVDSYSGIVHSYPVDDLVFSDETVSYSSSGVRPVFYLKSNVEIIADDKTDGSYSAPFRVQ